MDAGLFETLHGFLADPGTGFLCGGFGAVAEFTRDGGEPVRLGPGLQVVTARGGVRIEADAAAVPLAYETPRRQRGWSEALDLCLPRDTLSPGRTAVTELGPDADALRPEDRDAVLFDLGLGFPNAAFCVRTAEPELLAVLRGACGTPLFIGTAGPAVVRSSPHRVVRSPLARVEVYQPIPPPDGASPDGPHTHLLPKLLAHGLTHPANLPVSDGLVPCLSLFPPPSLVDGRLDRPRFDAFQALLDRYADPDWLRAKRAAVAGESVAPTRHASLAARLARRQSPFLLSDPVAAAAR